jgi:hypothetical protein
VLRGQGGSPGFGRFEPADFRHQRAGSHAPVAERRIDIGPANFPEGGLEPYGGLTMRVLVANPSRDLLFEQGGIAALHLFRRYGLQMSTEQPFVPEGIAHGG